MRHKISASVKIERSEDRGENGFIQVELMEGMPTLYRVTHSANNKTVSMELTKSEIEIIQSLMYNFNNLREMIDHNEDKDEYERSIKKASLSSSSMILGGGGGSVFPTTAFRS